MAEKTEKKKLPSVYSFKGIVIDQDNVQEFNRSEGQDAKWYTDCFVVEIPCSGSLCRLIKTYLSIGGKVFAKDPGPMHLFLEPYDKPNAEGWSAWTRTA